MASFTTTGCRFSVSRTKKMRQTLASLNASKQKKNKVRKLSVTLAAKDPQYQGMSAAEMVIVKKAHHDGYAMASVCAATISNDARYKTWFGAHTAARFKIAKDVFTNVKTQMETIVFTYIKGGPDCTAGTVAYTFDNSDKIHLCGPFWNLPSSGIDSKSGTIVHEHTHATATTEDYANDTTAAQSLAKTNPDYAVDNACNFEYFAES